MWLVITTEKKINRRSTPVETLEVYVPAHVALRIFIMQALASQLLFITGCFAIGEHVALLSGSTVYSLYYVITVKDKQL